MEFTRQLLGELKDTGKNICVFSKKISDLLRKNYNFRSFSEYTSRSYYKWIKEERPIPSNVLFEVMRDEKLQKVSIEYFTISGGNKIKFPDDNDCRFCYLLGLILGDGCLIHRKRDKNKNTYLVNISFKDKKDAERSGKVIEGLFGIKPTIHLGRGCYVLLTHSKPLVLILNKKYQIPIGIKYDTIQIPKMIYIGNGKMKKAFIKGVFDSDGNLYIHRNNKCVQLRQKSQSFLNEMMKLLSSLDLNFRNPYYDKANNSWLLWTSKKSLVDSFINKIIDFKV